MATQRQLIDAGVAPADELPPRPWLRIRGSGDASMFWYAVMRKRTHGIFIGSMVIRHGDYHASLLRDGWEEIDVDTVRASFTPAGSGAHEDGPVDADPASPGP